MADELPERESLPGGVEEPGAAAVAGVFFRLASEEYPQSLPSTPPATATCPESATVPTHLLLKVVEVGLVRRLAVSDSAEIPAARNTSALEPVPVDGCRVCEAAVKGRAMAHEQRLFWAAARMNAIIAQHPHRRAVDDALVATDDRSFSATMQRLRPQVERGNRHAREAGFHL
ncbi:hypothetical protein [Streptomyces sp. NPDC087294]|uniref:hypothetical protein n=1 Tax=Streptomyces sp. NPDC087294 TaxID=3365777 RepID=UPI003813E863